MSDRIAYKEESHQNMGACLEVYRQMGTDYLEAVYQKCIAIEFTAPSVPLKEQKPLKL